MMMKLKSIHLMDVISCQNLLEYIGYEESFASAIILSIFKM